MRKKEYCNYETEAFVEWLNNVFLKENERKAKIIKKNSNNYSIHDKKIFFWWVSANLGGWCCEENKRAKQKGIYIEMLLKDPQKFYDSGSSYNLLEE